MNPKYQGHTPSAMEQLGKRVDDLFWENQRLTASNAELARQNAELRRALQGLLAAGCEEPPSMDDHAAHTDHCICQIDAQELAAKTLANCPEL